MGDHFIADWEAFANEPPRDLVMGEYGNACGLAGFGTPGAPATGADIGLATGWGDVYAHDTEANFAEFSAATDGYYVINGETDPANTLLEGDDTDNRAYAYILVRGNCLTVLERGFGTSPWDPAKTLVEDIREPLVEGQCAA